MKMGGVVWIHYIDSMVGFKGKCENRPYRKPLYTPKLNQSVSSALEEKLGSHSLRPPAPNEKYQRLCDGAKVSLEGRTMQRTPAQVGIQQTLMDEHLIQTNLEPRSLQPGESAYYVYLAGSWSKSNNPTDLESHLRIRQA